MALQRYMKMFLLKIYLILATIVLLVDGAKWQTRYNMYSTGILQDVVMECTVEPGANFTGFYRQNGVKIVHTDRTKIEKSDNTVTLDIARITEADYDSYYCNDTSGGDKAILEVIASLERDPESPQILLAGDPGEIEYRVYGMPRPRKITWQIGSNGKAGSMLASVDNTGTVTDPSGGRYTIDNKGNLKIKKIKAEDAGDYFIAVQTFGGGRLKGNLAVKVEFKLELKTKPPASFVRAVGQDLFIPCEFLYADSEIRWTFTSTDGVVKTITEGAFAKGLNLTSVTIASEGTYTCSASNKYGNLSSSSSLKQVIDPAKITTDFQGVIKKKLTTLYELVCVAAGKPKPNVRLSKLRADNGALDVIASGVGQVSKEFTKLAIPDGGLYSCYVDNNAKTLKGASMAETKNMTLEVYASTEIDEGATTQSVTSAIGLNFTIQCSARGYPYPTVRLIGNGEDIGTDVEEAKENGVVTAKMVVKEAKQENFAYENITCFATNAYGTENTTIPLKQIRKAPCPKKLRSVGEIGLSIIELAWERVPGADKYYIYINDTRGMVESEINKVAIKDLKRKTYYSMKVASVNLAGVGSHCDPVSFETADIVKPNAIAATEFTLEEITSRSVSIRWKAPSNIPERDIDVLTYDTKYCLVRNESVVESTCKESKEKKENKVKLKELVEKTNYQIVVTAINQGKRGEISEPFLFETEAPPEPSEAPSVQQSPGLSSGEIAGIIVAIILIVLIVVDVFCCFFNNCGFSHCCFETFCASKDKKFLPVDTNDTNGANEAEGYEAQELEEKATVDDVV